MYSTAMHTHTHTVLFDLLQLLRHAVCNSMGPLKQRAHNGIMQTGLTPDDAESNKGE